MKTAWMAFILAFILTLFLGKYVHAQSGDNLNEVAKKYGVTFPVKELGGCNNISECRNFCEDPLNQSICINYAKQKGFYKEQQVDANRKEILDKAKTALGCDSIDSCKTFCQIPTNFDKCDTFAKSQNLVGGHTEDPKNSQIVSKAKQVLGCDSYASCASFCSDDDNRTKCSEFAKQVGLNGGERPVGPGGCTNEDSCKKFCSAPENFQVCKGFVESAGAKFSGPGNCNSEDSCKSYCQSHENECRSFSGGPASPPAPGFNPQEMCNRTPRCSWNNNTCSCVGYGSQSEEEKKRAEEFAKICREHPNRCTPGGIGGYDSAQDRSSFERYCKDNPEKCRPTYSNYTGNLYDPAIECGKYQSCSWTNGSCQCSSVASQTQGQTPTGTTNTPAGTSTSGGNYSGSGNYTGGYNGNPISRDQQETTCRAGGGSCDWSLGVCNCRGYQSPTSGTIISGSSGTTTTPTTTTTAPSGISRDQQAAGCSACGGTCSWNGDFCSCQCKTSGSSTPTSTSPPTTSSSAPAPAGSSAPTTQTITTTTTTTTSSAPAPASSPTGSTRGVSTARNLLQLIWDWIR